MRFAIRCLVLFALALLSAIGKLSAQITKLESDQIQTLYGSVRHGPNIWCGDKRVPNATSMKAWRLKPVMGYHGSLAVPRGDSILEFRFQMGQEPNFCNPAQFSWVIHRNGTVERLGDTLSLFDEGILKQVLIAAIYQNNTRKQ